MNITESTVSGAFVLSVRTPRMDASAAAGLRDHLLKSCDAGHSELIVDLTDVTFIDSSGLGALVSFLKHAGAGGNLVLVGARESVKSLFKITRLERVFRFFPTLETGAAGLLVHAGR